MKALIITTICVIIIFFAGLIRTFFAPHETLDKVMGDGIVQRLEDEKNSSCACFNIPISNSNSSVVFREDGKVYVRLNSGAQTFDITEVQQLHRLEDLKNFMQQRK